MFFISLSHLKLKIDWRKLTSVILPSIQNINILENKKQ